MKANHVVAVDDQGRVWIRGIQDDGTELISMWLVPDAARTLATKLINAASAAEAMSNLESAEA